MTNWTVDRWQAVTDGKKDSLMRAFFAAKLPFRGWSNHVPIFEGPVDWEKIEAMVLKQVFNIDLPKQPTEPRVPVKATKPATPKPKKPDQRARKK